MTSTKDGNQLQQNSEASGQLEIQDKEQLTYLKDKPTFKMPEDYIKSQAGAK